MKKTIILLFSFLLTLPTISKSQNAEVEKTLKKVNKLIDKNKFEKAANKMDDLLLKYPGFGSGWDILTAIKERIWQDHKRFDSFLSGNIVVEYEGVENEEQQKKLDSLNLKDLLIQISPSKRAYRDYLFTMKKAVAHSNTAFRSSINLRSLYRTTDVDTNVTEKAIEYFNAGEQEFNRKNYEDAIIQYQKALDIQPNYYKAKLYIGDSHYFLKNYDKAIEIFEEAKNLQPQFLEPRKYLIDAYARKKLYASCLTESIDAFATYPDLSMRFKFEDAVRLNDKKLTVGWTPRGCLPNRITEEKTNEKDIATSSWKHYQNAKIEFAKHHDTDIIINKDAYEKVKYLEVYSWEKMIEKSTPSELKDAKKMRKAGYLDCYVFLTCFHPDIYNQYRHFADNNRDKIIEYFELIIEGRTKKL